MEKLIYNYQSKGLSDFVIKVLQATEKIPHGKVITYSALAQAIGAPQAARAVGSALHVNPFAPAVPCHRVIKSDGSLGGYGLWVKKKLAILNREGIEFMQNFKIKDANKILTSL